MAQQGKGFPFQASLLSAITCSLKLPFYWLHVLCWGSKECWSSTLRAGAAVWVGGLFF